MLKPRLIESTKQPFLAGTSAGPTGGGAGNHLNFVIQHQEQDNWCWAAVTVSIFDFYRHSTGSTQCEVVNIEKGRTDCCVNGSSSYCNAVGPLDRPLQRNNNLNVMKSGPTALAVLRIEIDNGRPVGCRVAWGRGAHFLVVYGYGDRLVSGMVINTIEIADPWYGDSSQNLANFPSGYQGGGSWTHSYFTKS